MDYRYKFRICVLYSVICTFYIYNFKCPIHSIKNTDAISKHDHDFLDIDVILTNITGKSTKSDDPRLLNVLRDYMIDPPSQKLYKISYPLVKTPQAETIEGILNKMVRLKRKP